jgi:hypothetical protein
VQEGIVSGKIVDQSAEYSLVFNDFFERLLDPYLALGSYYIVCVSCRDQAVDLQSRVRRDCTGL